MGRDCKFGRSVYAHVIFLDNSMIDYCLSVIAFFWRVYLVRTRLRKRIKESKELPEWNKKYDVSYMHIYFFTQKHKCFKLIYEVFFNDFSAQRTKNFWLATRPCIIYIYIRMYETTDGRMSKIRNTNVIKILLMSQFKVFSHRRSSVVYTKA